MVDRKREGATMKLTKKDIIGLLNGVINNCKYIQKELKKDIK